MTAAASPNTRIEPASHATSGSEVLIGGCPVSDLARQFGTPLYVLDQASLTGMARAYQAMLDTYPGESLVLFAAKAHCNMGLCQLMQQLDCGLDLVSGGEVHTARQAGFNLANTLFNGNNKSDDELAYALAHGVGLISVDNATELEQLARVAMANGRHATILLRVAPGIECHTHDYIKTGHLDSKFGFDLSQIDAALKTISTANSAGNSPVLTLAGLHAHIGSQIFELQPYQDLATTMLAEYERIRRQHGLVMTHIDLGGGLGIKYTEADDPPSVETLAGTLVKALVDACDAVQYPYPKLLIEPGRSMVATAGTTLYEIGSFKHIPQLDKTYVAVNGGMGDNIRVALYQAQYTARVATRINEPHTKPVALVGRYCESGDILFDRLLVPETIAPGDLLIVYGTGAYNASMASNYNRVPRPATVLVKDGQAQVLVKRETWDDMTRLDLPLRPV
ncbi:MAG: diaminopimelate decarboxylase [Cyanobacteria bacterium HKST-UBA04]|nr:diaminopimelate decarboxylase [Cyanobacteria bacterium HKST-UBA04]